MKWLLVLLFSVSLMIIISGSVQAGISLGKGAITLSAGETEEMCDVWIYATQDGGRYTVETTGELAPLTVGITPNNFELESIDCPEETTARRTCIAETCLSENSPSCKIVCVRFTAPMLMGWDNEKVKYDGSILNSIKIGAATVKEPYQFAVYVEPADIRPTLIIIIVVIVVIVVIAALATLFARKRKK